jgi:ComF family protein
MKIPLKKILFWVREYLFPGGCALCGGALLDPDECWYGLCRACGEGCAVSRENRCGRCGRILVSEEGECLSCREAPAGDCGRTVSLFPYAGKYRKLLAAYKFGKSRPLGHFLADRVLEFLDSLPPEEGEAWRRRVWVPVPPRPGKLRASGWDQTAYLARLLKKRLPLSSCLRRLRSRSQKELSQKDRRTNLRGRIRPRGTPPPEAVLLDDVLTTGSTLEACAAALKAGGTQSVRGFCLFHS